MILKQKLTLIQSNVKAFKTEMKGAIETKCVNEIGGNMLSQALASKSVSRNEIEEMTGPLGDRATLRWIVGATHGFSVDGRELSEVASEVAAAIRHFVDSVCQKLSDRAT